jgi:hypothetical protein
MSHYEVVTGAIASWRSEMSQAIAVALEGNYNDFLQMYEEQTRRNYSILTASLNPIKKRLLKLVSLKRIPVRFYGRA